jgi:hypothetical protein
MGDNMGPCRTCGRAVQGYDLLASVPPDSDPYGPPVGQRDELDVRSSIMTLIPCGCHVLGDVSPTIRQLLAAAARPDPD